MGDYLDYKRNVLNTPHPMYGGNMAGFGVGDLSPSCSEAISVFDAVSYTVPVKSSPIPVAANAIEMKAVFSDLHTACTITVYKSDGVTVLATFDNVSTLNADNLFVGFFEQRVLIGGGDLVFGLSNWSGTGTLALGVRRTG